MDDHSPLSTGLMAFSLFNKLNTKHIKTDYYTKLKDEVNLLDLFCQLLLFRDNKEQSTIKSACSHEDLLFTAK